MAQRIDLGGDWQLTLGRRAAVLDPDSAQVAPAPLDEHDHVDAALLPTLTAGVSAQVPGCVHLDLLAHGLIPDPLLGTNELAVQWIGRQEWVYQREFHWDPAPDAAADLIFEGLDTFAEVFLNGELVAQSTNQHVPLRVPVTSRLRQGQNTLRIVFASAYAHAYARAELYGPMPNSYTEPFQYVRKTACNFGWDWGPTLVTAGVWRPVYLEVWQGARVVEAVPQVSVLPPVSFPDSSPDADPSAPPTVTGQVQLSLQLAADPTQGAAAGLGLVLDCEVAPALGGAPLITHQVPVSGVTEDPTFELSTDFTVPKVELWWPRGFGGQPLYFLTLRLRDAAGRVLDEWQRRIGFRTVELVQQPDEHGTSFVVQVNGQRVDIRGVNWIPDDVFPTRVTPERYRQRLEQACAAGVNTLRVWGGGNYEDHAFYAAADELGLLVGQDFLFACAAYPEDEVIRREVAAEARANVARLAHHPSLGWWFGGNETFEGFADWGWQEELAGRPWGAGYYLEVLPQAVAEVDPTRPYWPNSPYSGDPQVHPLCQDVGTVHIWDVWNRADFTHYRKWRPRFAAEFGYQAPANYATLRGAVGVENLAPTSASPVLNHHQKAADGDAKLQRGIDLHLGEVSGFDDWHFATQLLQARAVSVGIEHFRSLHPVCSGTIWWQLNDIWPAMSWAVLDFEGGLKPAWFALRRAYRDQLATFSPDAAGRPTLVLVNDCAAPWSEDAVIELVSFTGEVLASQPLALHLPPRASQRVELSDALCVPADPSRQALVVQAGGERTWWFFTEDKHLDLAPASWTAEVEPNSDGVLVRVTALTFVRDLCLFPDRVLPDAQVDQALVTLLPGEVVEFNVRFPGPQEQVTLEAFTRPAVLRSAGSLFGGQ